MKEFNIFVSSSRVFRKAFILCYPVYSFLTGHLPMLDVKQTNHAMSAPFVFAQPILL